MSSVCTCLGAQSGSIITQRSNDISGVAQGSPRHLRLIYDNIITYVGPLGTVPKLLF